MRTLDPPVKRVTEQTVNVLGMLFSGHSILVAVVPVMDVTAFAAPSPDAVAVATVPACRGVGQFRIQGPQRSWAEAGGVGRAEGLRDRKVQASRTGPCAARFQNRVGLWR